MGNQLREGLQVLSKSVKDNEPNCSRYQVYEQTNAEGDPPQFVVVEEYADKAAFDFHISTQAFKDLGAQIQKENWLAKPLDIKFVGTCQQADMNVPIYLPLLSDKVPSGGFLAR